MEELLFGMVLKSSAQSRVTACKKKRKHAGLSLCDPSSNPSVTALGTDKSSDDRESVNKISLLNLLMFCPDLLPDVDVLPFHLWCPEELQFVTCFPGST